MKMLMSGLALSLVVLATGVQAELKVTVNGEEVAVSTLMDNCKSMSGEPEAQIACFSAISQLLDNQGDGGAAAGGPVQDALDHLRAVAQYQDNETGLKIEGKGCDVQFTYFANYFHVSRRNVSNIDLYHARFDAAKLQLDATLSGAAAGTLVSKGVMDTGAVAATRGGVALDSNAHQFSPKSARTTVDVYASEVVGELPAQTGETFSFVLVHPRLSETSAEILSAFETYVAACQG